MPDLPVSSPRSRFTDSPLFWIALFGGMAMVALFAVGPKYARRQQRLERMYLAREQVAQQQGEATNGPPADPPRANPSGSQSASQPIVPLQTLSVVLLSAAAMAAAAVYLARRRIAAESHPPNATVAPRPAHGDPAVGEHRTG